MEFRILGAVEVVDGNRAVPLPRLKQRAVLTLLLLNAGKPIAADRMIEDLWTHPPPAARQALQNNVAQLRRQLGPGLLVTRSGGYVFDVIPDQIDLGRFRVGVDAARAIEEPAQRAALRREALGLWRGEPFPELVSEPFAELERQSLLAERRTAQKDLIDDELRLGRHAEVIAQLESLVVDDRYDERLYAQLMLALYRAGRPTDSLNAFERARRDLDEIGLTPSPELHALQRAILNHDPDLLLPRPRAHVETTRRKSVTVVFAGLPELDATDGTPDAERLAWLANRLAGDAAAAAARHGGTVDRLADGTAMAVFGVPEAHEDDALRAIRAARELRDALRAGGLEARIGVCTGEVLVDNAAVVGTGVAIARALEQAAAPGEILLALATLRILRGTVVAEALELQETVPQGFRLLELAQGADPRPPRDTPLVARRSELVQLRKAFQGVQTERRCRVVTVVGEAGIGKTRLALEVCGGVREHADVLVGRCVSYGEGASYLPLRELVEQSGEELDAVLAGAGSVGEEHLKLRTYFARLANERPLVLVLEDIHWAEPTLLDLIESFGALAGEAPILVLCLARPDLLDVRPTWPVTLTLAPLERDELVELLAGGNGDVEPGLTRRIAELAEGNPLYAEQLLAYAREGGSLDSVPPTIEALLMSRIDRLPPEERAVLEAAAVVGREFDRGTLAALAPVTATVVDSHVAALERARLVRRTSRLVYQFQHVLIRDVTYGGLPKAQRGELHERVADVFDRQGGHPDELVGHHLEQAFRCLSEVGADPGGRRLDVEAGTRLGAAGVAAWKRGDTSTTLNLLQRATSLLPRDDPFRLALCSELGVALRGAGNLGEADEVLSAAASTAAAAGDRPAALRARLELANVRLLAAPGDRAAQLLAVVEEAIPLFEAAGDDHALSRAWRLRAYVEGSMACRYAASAESAELALKHCKQSGWSTAACLGDLAAALYHGPTPVDAGIRRCRQLLSGADMGGEANVLVQLGGLEAMRGDLDTARTLIARSQQLYEQLGQPALAYANCGELLGTVELLAGDPSAAAEAFRESCDALESIGDRAYLATRAAQLAGALYADGHLEAAAEWCRVAEESAAPDDVPTQFMWRAVRAKLLATQGEVDEALSLGREAMRLAAQTDALNQRGDVAFALAEALRLSGRTGEWASTASEALALYDQKGNVVAAARVRSLLST